MSTVQQTAYRPADTSEPVSDLTVGELLRVAAADATDTVRPAGGRPARLGVADRLRAERPDVDVRRAAHRRRGLRTLAAAALRARRADRGVGAERARVGRAAVRRRPGRARPRHREPGVARRGAALRAAAVPRRRALLHTRLPGHGHGRHRRGGGTRPPRAARAGPLRRLAAADARGAAAGWRAARRRPRRRRPDPVHVRHHRLPQGCAARPSRARDERPLHRCAGRVPPRRHLPQRHAAVPHLRLRDGSARQRPPARHAGPVSAVRPPR